MDSDQVFSSNWDLNLEMRTSQIAIWDGFILYLLFVLFWSVQVSESEFICISIGLIEDDSWFLDGETFLITRTVLTGYMR